MNLFVRNQDREIKLHDNSSKVNKNKLAKG